jgi:cytochrome c peroxidase
MPFQEYRNTLMMILILKTILLKKQINTLTEAVSYLSKNKDFETFDRIEFYKKYIQPLYEELGRWDGDLMI